MKNVSKTCGEIQTDGGFEYRLQALNPTLSGDCEHSWYSEDRRLLADPSDPHKLMYPVTSVSSDRLVTSYCVDELHHEIQCHFKGVNQLNLSQHSSVFIFKQTEIMILFF
ncbi:hypothetical protein DPX16_0325 [Anabarilius grahami]|uniref:Uncharacterized protein n=1 Tax=Anabarilius grahami TaxID=495550 RepID=A0A3N0YK12_ANAGA|nr:hypothetical protein DPX16_0325 [Anabarilius grahami]